MKFFTCTVLLLALFQAAYSQTTSPNRVYEIWDNKPAPNRGSDFSRLPARGYPFDTDWESESYPIGNGYMGANIFGRTDVERIQITEKTLLNESPYRRGGITGFCEIYLDFHHHNPQNYRRSLNLNDAVLSVDYKYNGVQYSREYFANYPENVIVLKLRADKEGAISFTLRGELPHLRGINEINARTGQIHTLDDLMVLSGNIAFFNINYEARVKVINDGGRLISSDDNPHAGIRVENANSVVILIAAGTNYELGTHIFSEISNDKKLDGNLFPDEKVSKRIATASSLGFENLRNNHLADFQKIFSRVKLELSSEISRITTRDLLKQYKSGNTHPYLEELMFHFGRYLLISSSRKGTLPAGLQGVWSHYAVTPWSGGYWHNINVQMNYWGAFNTNMAETFIPYLEYFEAYSPRARLIATEFIRNNYPHNLDDDNQSNGWAIGTGASAFNIDSPGGHSGPGTGGLTSKMFWDYYEFTRDTTFLREVAYPAIFGMSTFLSKTLKPFEGGLLLVDPSASPEIMLMDERGGFRGRYYVTTGTTFDQGFVWETHNDLLKAAAILGKVDPFLDVVRDQITRLDPIIIGASGQIKEFREENVYGEIGDPHHRHISHLCPLYPGTLINSGTPEWMKGASVVLDKRGNRSTGWGLAHRMNLRARIKDGENAHEVFSILIKERTLPNLWTVHPPFQIDANLGLVAGVAEMLIQSHEGFIELLPALPQAWKTGRFDGLVARGNFDISADWQDRVLSSVDVVSHVGGPCNIRFDQAKVAGIRDNAGNTIEFSHDENNIVTFNTIRNGSYRIVFSK